MTTGDNSNRYLCDMTKKTSSEDFHSANADRISMGKAVCDVIYATLPIKIVPTEATKRKFLKFICADTKRRQALNNDKKTEENLG